MQTGLFGKMPAHGDFVRRALPRSFVAPWDAWLSNGIHAARAALREGWDAAWEAAPVWRFRLSPGGCGPDAVVGVIATSRDAVGRQFPLTLAAILPGAAVPPPDDWYEVLEAALRRACAGELDADSLAAALPQVPLDDPDMTLDGRSVFWSARLPGRRMPDAADFVVLLQVVPPGEAAGAAAPGEHASTLLAIDALAADAPEPAATAGHDDAGQPLPNTQPEELHATGAVQTPSPGPTLGDGGGESHWGDVALPWGDADAAQPQPATSPDATS